MVNQIKLRLGSKDNLIRNYWVSQAEAGENVSRIITAALEYYIKTGEYLELGTVNNSLDVETGNQRIVCIAENSVATQWLESRKSVNEPASTAIKRVLRNSLKSGNETVLLGLDEIMSIVERAASNTANVVSPPPQITVSQKSIVEDNIVSTDNNKYEVDNVVYYDDEDDDEESGDESASLYSMMLGDIPLSL